jgi:hypothetical protein
MQYVHGLMNLGCDVYWLEQFPSSGDLERDNLMRSTLYERLDHFGLDQKGILYTLENSETVIRYIGIEESRAEAIFHEADLLLNFNYHISPTMLSAFQLSALVDIDPGLLQFWMSQGQINVLPHDLYFTIGETVGTPEAKFPDCDIDWIRIRPPVSLDLWPYSFSPESSAFTTVSSWWGGGGLDGEWVSDGKDVVFENNKRVSFLRFLELPRLVNEELQLALNLGEIEPEIEIYDVDDQTQEEIPPKQQVTDYISDSVDHKMLVESGWQIRHSYEVSSSPEKYQTYIQYSRGEYSCAKPSCMYFQNAWISDRTLCYLASGKPVVIQHTGPSSYLPNGEGMFRFSTLDEAADAINSIAHDYERHCIAAREIAEEYFDAKKSLATVLNFVN